jgi:hypothetical protein
MATNGQDVSFGCASGVCSVPAQGGSVVTLPSLGTTPFSISMDSQYTYWAAPESGEVLRTLTNGQGSASIIASAVQPYAVYVDTTNAYFLENNGLTGRLFSVPKGGGTVVSIPPPANWYTLGGPLFGEGPYVYTQVGSMTGTSYATMQVLPPNTVNLLGEPPTSMWSGFFPAGNGMLFFFVDNLPEIGLYDPASGSVPVLANAPSAGIMSVLYGPGAPAASCGEVVGAYWVPFQIWNQTEVVVPIMGGIVSDGTFLYEVDGSNIYRTALP